MGVGVVGAEDGFEDDQGLFEVGMSSGVVAHILEQDAEIVQAILLTSNIG